MTVIAKFSGRRLAGVSAQCFALFAVLAAVPALNGESPVEHMASSWFGWFWPVGVCAGAYLTLINGVALSRYFLFKNSALYISGDDLVYMYKWMGRIDIRDVNYVARTYGRLGLDLGVMEIGLNNNKTRRIRCFTLDKGVDDVVALLQGTIRERAGAQAPLP